MKRRQRILLFVVGAIAVCVLLAVVSATVMSARAKARRAACPDQVKQLSLAQKMYAPGFDEMGRPLEPETQPATDPGP